MTTLVRRTLERAGAIHDAHKARAERNIMAGAGSLPAVEGQFTGRDKPQSLSLGSPSDNKYGHFRHWVYTCVNAISEAVSALPWQAAELTEAAANPERRMGGISQKVPRQMLTKVREGQELQPILAHPSLDLVECPNYHQPHHEFVYFSVANLEITGECYWVLGVADDNATPQIYAVPSSWMAYNAKTDEYKLKPPGMTQGVSVPTEYVARTHFPDPGNPMGCWSPLSACLSAVKVDDYIQRSQQMSFDRGIHPNLIITVGKKPGQTDRPRLNGVQRRQFVQAIREIW